MVTCEGVTLSVSAMLSTTPPGASQSERTAASDALRFRMVTIAFSLILAELTSTTSVLLTPRALESDSAETAGATAKDSLLSINLVTSTMTWLWASRRRSVKRVALHAVRFWQTEISTASARVEGSTPSSTNRV